MSWSQSLNPNEPWGVPINPQEYLAISANSVSRMLRWNGKDILNSICALPLDLNQIMGGSHIRRNYHTREAETHEPPVSVLSGNNYVWCWVHCTNIVYDTPSGLDASELRSRCNWQVLHGWWSGMSKIDYYYYYFQSTWIWLPTKFLWLFYACSHRLETKIQVNFRPQCVCNCLPVVHLTFNSMS